MSNFKPDPYQWPPEKQEGEILAWEQRRIAMAIYENPSPPSDFQLPAPVRVPIPRRNPPSGAATVPEYKVPSEEELELSLALCEREI